MEFELDQMERYGVRVFAHRNDLFIDQFEKLSVRWVKEIRNDEWRCRLVGREFKFLDPKREGLFTVASAQVTGRLIDFHGTKRGYKRLIGDATNAYFNTPQNRKVYIDYFMENMFSSNNVLKPISVSAQTWLAQDRPK